MHIITKHTISTNIYMQRYLIIVLCINLYKSVLRVEALRLGSKLGVQIS